MFSSPTTADPFSATRAGMVSQPVASSSALRSSRSTGDLVVEVVEPELGQALADAAGGGTPFGLEELEHVSSPHGDDLA